MMSPQQLLAHLDGVTLWPGPFKAGDLGPSLTSVASTGLATRSDAPHDVLAEAYQSALAVRALRVARDEQPRGYKVGFTNRTIWQRYNVFAPIWGTVWDTTLSFAPDPSAASPQDTQAMSLAAFCQPRIEPEVVFGLRATPPVNATLQALFQCIAWVAPGFEVVQSHRPNWQFTAPDTVADGGLHGHLRVGTKVPVQQLGNNAQDVAQHLASAKVRLLKNSELIEQGLGANVLDSPLHALHHFLQTLRACPGAPDLQAGDVVTTGTWTDAYAISAGEAWTAEFDAPLGTLNLSFI